MANTPKVFVICDNNCKYEGMTKEQILAAIVQAVNEGTIGEIDTGFITTIKTVNGTPLKFFVGTQAEYEALADKQDLFAIITNDTTKEGLLGAFSTLQTDFNEFARGISDGTIVVMNASQLNNNGTIFARRSILLGSPMTVAASDYRDFYTTEDACNRYLVVETETFRTYPMLFDTTKYTSVSQTFENSLGNIEILMDYTNPKKVRVYNRSQNSILVKNIYVEL